MEAWLDHTHKARNTQCSVEEKTAVLCRCNLEAPLTLAKEILRGLGPGVPSESRCGTCSPLPDEFAVQLNSQLLVQALDA